LGVQGKDILVAGQIRLDANGAPIAPPQPINVGLLHPPAFGSLDLLKDSQRFGLHRDK